MREHPTPENIEVWLRPFVDSKTKSVIELRVLNHATNRAYRGRTVSGYYDWKHLGNLAQDAMTFTYHAEGCYVTINPVKPALQARARNLTARNPKHTTTDEDILRRIGLVFDTDPDRQAGISATYAEKEAARERIEQLISHLSGLGWPEPILADSGNGYHARYKINLTVDDGGLVGRVLKAADARFSDEHVKIDTRLGNPSRIIKLYGTKSRKGEDTPDRPHRWTRVCSIPDEYRVVPSELLEAFAAEVVQRPVAVACPSNVTRSASNRVSVAGDRSSPEARARAYIFAPGFPDSVAGQNGHGRLYHVASVLVDDFGLTFDQALPIFEDWNREKARPPESDRQVRHKLEDAIKNHPSPSLRLLNADRDHGQPVDSTVAAKDTPIHTREWLPLRLNNCPPVLPFPVDVYPRSVAQFVEKVATSIGCPEDFVGLPILITTGAAIGRRVSLRLRPNHFASASLYGMNVGGPSSGKSPALEFVVRPFWKINRLLLDAYRLAKDKYDQAMELRKSADKDKQGAAPPKPVLGSVVLDDVTVEAISRLLTDNPKGLLIARDEGTALLRSFNQYKAGGKGSDLQFFLSALMGKPVRVDRKGQTDGIPILVDDPFLAIIGNIPPDLLREFREKREVNDGLVERFLFVIPDPRPRPRWSKVGVSDEINESWSKLVDQLRSIEMPLKNGVPCPHIVSFTTEAERFWEEWYNSHAEEVNSPGFDDEGLAAEVKLVDFVGRFVVILHLLSLCCDPGFSITGAIPMVPPSIVRGAIRLWEFFRSHQARVRWHLSGGFGHRCAARIIGWLRRTKRVAFTLKELNDHIRSGAGENENALEWMQSHGLVRPLAEALRAKSQRGRRPSPAYEVNPDLHECGSRYSQNSPSRTSSPSTELVEHELRANRQNREVESPNEVAVPEADSACDEDSVDHGLLSDGEVASWSY
jgi:hypothetical protein